MNKENGKAFVLGFESGEACEQDRIVELLKAEIKRVSNPMLVDREYLDGLETAIDLIKGKSNATNFTGSTLPKIQVRCGVHGCNCEGESV